MKFSFVLSFRARAKAKERFSLRVCEEREKSAERKKKSNRRFDGDTLKYKHVKKKGTGFRLRRKTKMLRKERELCYKHRDAYYEALSSSSSSSNTISNNKRELKQLKKLFEKHCPSSWVEHFEKIRLDQLKFTNLTKEEEEEEEKS